MAERDWVPVAKLAAKLGTTAFGGPAAHIAMLRHEVVERRGWLDERRFLDLNSAASLIPGPNSTELVMHVGHDQAGRRGLLAAGLAFITPAALITLTLAVLYERYGATPTGESLLDGIQPVVLAIVAQAVVAFGRKSVTTPLAAVTAAAVVALYLLGVNELVLLAAGALFPLVVRWRPRREQVMGLVPVWPSGLGVLPVVVEQGYSHGQLFWTFLRIGAVLYGSGYVLVAFLRNEFVERLGWLTEQQLLDAVAIGQVTPGPVFTTATFVGYVTGGYLGALLATLAIFLPAFVLVGVTHGLVDRMRRSATLSRLLDGLNVSSTALMLAVLIVLARDALDGPLATVVTLAAAAALFTGRLGPTALIALGAVVGIGAGWHS